MLRHGIKRWEFRGRESWGRSHLTQRTDPACTGHPGSVGTERRMLRKRERPARPDRLCSVPSRHGGRGARGPLRRTPARRRAASCDTRAGRRRTHRQGASVRRRWPPGSQAMRFFNTAGPVNPADHYCIPPLARSDPDEVLLLVRMKKYFVLHAPRQTGKTSGLLALRDLLNGHRAAAACTPPPRPPARPAATWSGRCGRCSAASPRGRRRPWATDSWTTPGTASSPSPAPTRRWATR